MSSQAAAEQREKAERGYLTIISWHTLGEAGSLFRSRDKWQTPDDEGVFGRKGSENAQRCIYLTNKEPRGGKKYDS